MSDRTLNILLVEDDEVDVMNVRRAFERNNVSNPLYVAGNGIEALEMLRNGTVPSERRLILLDLNMPRKDGREALREIKNSPEFRRTPVVVFTTSKADTDIGQIYDIGANSFISKPVSFESLVEVMKTLGRYWCATVRLPFKP